MIEGIAEITRALLQSVFEWPFIKDRDQEMIELAAEERHQQQADTPNA